MITFKRLIPLLLLPVMAGCAGKPDTPPVQAALDPAGRLQTVNIEVRYGYQPDKIIARPGVPLRLNFHRDEAQGSCARDLEIPSQKIAVTLPNHAVHTIDLPAQPAGTEIPFRCSMDMMRGTITFESAGTPTETP